MSKGPPSMGTEREAQWYLKNSQSGATATTLNSTPRMVRVARARARSNGSQVGEDGDGFVDEQELMRNIKPCATQMDTFDQEEELELLEAAELIEAGELSVGQESGCSSWSRSCQRSGMNSSSCTQVQSLTARENQFNAVNNVNRSPPRFAATDGPPLGSPPMAPSRKPARMSGEKKLIPGTQVDDDWSDIELGDLDAICTQVSFPFGSGGIGFRLAIVDIRWRVQ